MLRSKTGRIAHEPENDSDIMHFYSQVARQKDQASRKKQTLTHNSMVTQLMINNALGVVLSNRYTVDLLTGESQDISMPDLDGSIPQINSELHKSPNHVSDNINS